MTSAVRSRWRPSWWGSRAHRGYTVVVFVLLASLDNTAITLMPPLYGVMSADLAVGEGALGLVTAAVILITAVSAAVWGYVGDRFNRKALLLAGTLLWTAGIAGTGIAASYAWVVVTQVAAAIGLGAIASIGFAVVSDLVSPRHRGVAMSFWGVSQGAGTLLGTLLGGVLGASDWRQPFLLVAAAGVAVTVAYLAGYDIPRGASEPELAHLFDEGEGYDERIEPSDLRTLVQRRTNLWLILQGFTAQFAYGSLVWLPRLFQAKVEAQGYDLATATVVGSIFATLFQLGAVLSIFGGWLGDRWQRRDLRGRALLSMIGILGAIPFFLVLFFLPLPIDLPPDPGLGATVSAILSSLVTNPAVAATFLMALVALALTSADSPNWFALIGDVNLPEHRGTVFGVGNLVNGGGRALGNGLVGLSFTALVARFPPPLNYAVGLAAFQLFFLPTGLAYWRASLSAPRDIREMHETLRRRAADTGRPDTPDTQDAAPTYEH